MPTRKIKPLFWVGDAAKAYREFSEDVQDDVGYALYLGQTGEKAVNAESAYRQFLEAQEKGNR